MASDSDSRQGTLFDVPPALPSVSVVRVGDAYRVTIRGEEVTLTDWSLLAFGWDNGKWNVEMGGKSFVMDDAEFDAFHDQLSKATPPTDDEGEDDDDAI